MGASGKENRNTKKYALNRLRGTIFYFMQSLWRLDGAGF
jgi:hypothetical protein